MKILKVLALSLFISNTFAQLTPVVDPVGGCKDCPRRITTAVPFLTIAPDARSSAMGDIGVSTEPDVFSTYWNSAKLAFTDSDIGVGISYSPWLRKLVNDMSVSYLTGYMKLNGGGIISTSLKYFDMGDMQFTNENGDIIQEFSPKEFAFDAGYTTKLSDNLSLGIALRFIHSNLSGNITLSNGTTTKPGNTAAGDISVYYNKDLRISDLDAKFAFGAVLSNIGGKISYTNNDNAEFIPTNLRFGPSLTIKVDEYNRFTVGVDINKLMVPSPPVYEYDANGAVVTDANGNPVIAEGKDPNKSSLAGVTGAFFDSPDGFSGELSEFYYGIGAEYWYSNLGKDLFAVRAGYYLENEIMGDRKYFEVGVGLKYSVAGFDFSYLIPTKGQNHQLAETLRFSLSFNFEKKNSTSTDSEPLEISEP